MDVRLVKVRELYDFIQDYLTRAPKGAIVPISLHRAHAQSLNPQALDTDVGLILAQDEGGVLGYLGILPALLWDGDTSQRVFFPSSIYVDKAARGRGVGKALVHSALKLKYDLVFTGISDEADRLYKSLRLAELTSLRYLEIDLTRGNPYFSLARVLARTSRTLRPHPASNCWLQAAAAWLVSSVSTATLRGFLSTRERVFDETTSPVCPRNYPEVIGRRLQPGDAFFYRDERTLKWMFEHPWVLPYDGKRHPDQRYYFANRRSFFGYTFLQPMSATTNGGRGALLLSRSRQSWATVVKVLDVVADDEDPTILLEGALQTALKVGACLVHLPLSFSSVVKACPGARTLVRSLDRKYFVYCHSPESPLARSLGRIALTYGDGDIAFH